MSNFGLKLNVSGPPNSSNPSGPLTSSRRSTLLCSYNLHLFNYFLLPFLSVQLRSLRSQEELDGISEFISKVDARWALEGQGRIL